MSSYTVQNSFDDLSGILKGKTPNKVTNILGVATRAGRALLSMIDPDETRRFSQIVLFDQVTDYNLPMTDLKEKAIFDVRPQTNRHQRDNFGSRMSKDFDMKAAQNEQGTWGSWFSVENDTGVNYIRVSKKFNPGAQGIDALDDATQWTGSGGATDLADDTIYVVDDGGSSISLDLAANLSPGYITNPKITTGDLTKFNKIASFFLYVYLPNAATDISGVKLRWGSSSAAYWEQTGVIHFGSKRQGWNLFRFDWPTAVQTGSVNPAKITYSRIEFDYPAAGVLGIRVNKLFASIPRIWQIGYYSNCLFTDVNSAVWQDSAKDPSNTINLAPTTYNLYLFELSIAALQQIKGSSDDIEYFEHKLYGDPSKPKNMGLYEAYEDGNPSQKEKVTQTWYGRSGRLQYKRK